MHGRPPPFQDPAAAASYPTDTPRKVPGICGLVVPGVGGDRLNDVRREVGA